MFIHKAEAIFLFKKMRKKKKSRGLEESFSCFFNFTGLLDGFKGEEGRNSRWSLSLSVGKL